MELNKYLKAANDTSGLFELIENSSDTEKGKAFIQTSIIQAIIGLAIELQDTNKKLDRIADSLQVLAAKSALLEGRELFGGEE